MLAPGAMGESRQVGSDKTEQGQAENRRVVVRALLNKGIAGTELPSAFDQELKLTFSLIWDGC